jgi:hypothetical protein
MQVANTFTFYRAISPGKRATIAQLRGNRAVVRIVRLIVYMNLLVLLLVLLLLFGGGGFYFGGPAIGGGGIGLILLIILIVYLVGGFRTR